MLSLFSQNSKSIESRSKLQRSISAAIDNLEALGQTQGSSKEHTGLILQAIQVCLLMSVCA